MQENFNSYRWHRLIKVIFIIITLIGVALMLMIGDWYSPITTVIYITIGVLLRLLVMNIIYYEGVVYVIKGKAGNSIFRYLKKNFNKVSSTRKKTILKSFLVLVAILALVKLIVFPPLSDFISEKGNDLLDKANTITSDVEIKNLVNKAKSYCKVGELINKSAKNLRCLGRAYHDNDTREATKYYEKALLYSPNNIEEMKIRTNLAGIHFFDNNDSEASEREISKVLKIDGVESNYDALYKCYSILGLIESNKKNLDGAISYIDKAMTYTETNSDKNRLIMNKANVYNNNNDPTSAYFTINTIDITGSNLSYTQLQGLENFKKDIIKKGINRYQLDNLMKSNGTTKYYVEEDDAVNYNPDSFKTGKQEVLSDVNFRASAGIDGVVIQKLLKGNYVDILDNKILDGNSDLWYYVDFNGKKGWITHLAFEY